MKDKTTCDICDTTLEEHEFHMCDNCTQTEDDQHVWMNERSGWDD